MIFSIPSKKTFVASLLQILVSREIVKNVIGSNGLPAKRIARQQWRAWIETSVLERWFVSHGHRPPAMAGVD